MTTNDTQLREEWSQSGYSGGLYQNPFADNFKGDNNDVSNEIEDWWISKFHEREDEIRGKIEGMKYRNTAHLYEGEMREFANKTIDDILSILTKPE